MLSFSPPRAVAILLAVCGELLSGCANMATTRTGFLGDYEQLKPDPKDSHRIVFEQSGWNKADYTSVWLEPTIVRLDVKEEKKITAQERTELAAYCDAAPKKVFAKDLKLVTAAEAGTPRIRAAVTRIDTSSPALNVVMGVLLWPVDNGGVSLEFEAPDAVRDERLAALVGYSEGTPLQVIGSFSRFGHARGGIDHWGGGTAQTRPPRGREAQLEMTAGARGASHRLPKNHAARVVGGRRVKVCTTGARKFGCGGDDQRTAL